MHVESALFYGALFDHFFRLKRDAQQITEYIVQLIDRDLIHHQTTASVGCEGLALGLLCKQK